MKFKGDFKIIEFNLSDYIRKLEKQMQSHLEFIARQWVVATTGRVPLWSGMARGSLLNLSRLVNGKIILSPLKTKSRIPQGISLGNAEIKIETPIYVFSVSTKVPHYVIQEYAYVGVSKTAPWQSFEAGRSVFEIFSKTIRLPTPDFKGKSIRV